MARVTTRGTGIQVDGLDESLKALGRLDKAYRKEAIDAMKVGAKDVARRARKNLNRVGRYPRASSAGSIAFSANAKGAGNKLRAASRPWLLGAEYGEVVAQVAQFDNPSIPVAQSKFKRRTFGRWRPPTSTDLAKNRGGYMIQPVIAQQLPKIDRQIRRDFQKLTSRTFRKAGVRGRG